MGSGSSRLNLFFSLYSHDNGYDQTEVFIADVTNFNKWARVKKPRDGERVTLNSATPLLVLVRTILRTGDFSQSDVQQSDYKYNWKNQKTAADNTKENIQATYNLKTEEHIRIEPRLMRIFPSIYSAYRKFSYSWNVKTTINKRNSKIEIIELKSLLK